MNKRAQTRNQLGKDNLKAIEGRGVRLASDSPMRLVRARLPGSPTRCWLAVYVNQQESWPSRGGGHRSN